MPAISAPATVLVTAANGHVGTHIVKALLDKGFSVKGTVRSASKGDYLRKIFAAAGDKFQYVVIPDVLAPGAYDEVVKDVDAVIHANFAISMEIISVDEVIKPSVDGTYALLDSIVKFGSKVKRFEVCSSVSAVFEKKEGPYTYSEADWNESSIATLNAQGAATGVLDLYNAGKTLQEKAVFDYAEKHKGTLNFDVVSILPGFSIGPILDEQEKPGRNSVWITFGAFTGAENVMQVGNIVDVRDVAEGHVLGLTVEEAAGQRFLIINRDFAWQEAYDILNDRTPKPSKVPEGTPGSGKAERPIKFDNTRSREVLGLKYRPVEETISDAYDEFVRRGWLDSA